MKFWIYEFISIQKGDGWLVGPLGDENKIEVIPGKISSKHHYHHYCWCDVTEFDLKKRVQKAHSIAGLETQSFKNLKIPLPRLFWLSPKISPSR